MLNIELIIAEVRFENYMPTYDLDKYCKERDWNAKVFSMPNIPRGKDGLVDCLRIILNHIDSRASLSVIPEIEGSNSKATLEELCVRLRPMGIVNKTIAGWEVSPESKLWLSTGENFYLAALFHANIRFFSELLAFLSKDPKTARMIRDYANKEYHFGWKTGSDVNSRLQWLRHLGFAQYEDYTMLYSITDLGKEFLSTVRPVPSGETLAIRDITESEPSIPVSTWAIDISCLTSQDLNKRKPSIGYMPGGKAAVIETVSEYLQLMDNGSSIDDIISYSKEVYGIKASSTDSYISTLTSLGFIDRKSRTVYQASNLGKKWSQDKSPVDFACCVHAKVLFMLEILSELNKKELSPKQLAVIAKVSYGFPKENSGEIHTRIHILRKALLVREVGVDKYTVTARGVELLKQVSVQEPAIATIEEVPNAFHMPITHYSVENLLTEIREASRDSSNPDRLEHAVQNGFEFLGFRSDWIGGSGNTDVLLKSSGSPKHGYTVTVDAKSTASGAVSESLVDFDTLNDHRKKHHADYTAIVGHSFQSERLLDRAKSHRVVLIDIDSLETIIKYHAEVPLQTESYRLLFECIGLVELDSLVEERNRVKRSGALLQAIMETLEKESSDPITNGILKERDIYRSLRNAPTFAEQVLTLEEINQMLLFLSSPLLGCVDKTNEGYYSLAAISDVAQKFDFYSRVCRKTTDQEQ